ncbi:MAG: hypothetical protein AAFV78_16760 [Bacteroidota bacterium]
MSIADYIGQIDDYLHQKLKPEEKEAFETAMERHPELKQEVRLQIQALMAIRQKALRIEQETPAEAPVPEPITSAQVRRIMPWLVAASTLVLLLSVLLILFNSGPSTEDVLAEYYFLPEPQIAMRGGDTPAEPSFAETYLYASYIGKDYEAVIKGADQVLADSLSDEKRSWLHLLVGVAHIETGNLDAAKVSLDQVDAHPNQQSWYQAMRMLHADQVAEAQDQLRIIANDSLHMYQPQAKNLLEAWDRVP